MVYVLMFKQYPIQPIHSDPILAWAKLVLLHCCLIGIICELFVTPSVTGCWAQLNWSLIRQVRIRLISAMTESVDFTKDAGIVHFFLFVGSGLIMDSVYSWFSSELFPSDTFSASIVQALPTLASATRANTKITHLYPTTTTTTTLLLYWTR